MQRKLQDGSYLFDVLERGLELSSLLLGEVVYSNELVMSEDNRVWVYHEISHGRCFSLDSYIAPMIL